MRWINPSWPINVIWCHKTVSTMAQVATCCLTAPTHYLNQCCLVINEIQRHSPEGNSQEIPQPLNTKIRLTITYQEPHSNFPEANELNDSGKMSVNGRKCRLCYVFFKIGYDLAKIWTENGPAATGTAGVDLVGQEWPGPINLQYRRFFKFTYAMPVVVLLASVAVWEIITFQYRWKFSHSKWASGRRCTVTLMFVHFHDMTFSKYSLHKS